MRLLLASSANQSGSKTMKTMDTWHKNLANKRKILACAITFFCCCFVLIKQHQQRKHNYRPSIFRLFPDDIFAESHNIAEDTINRWKLLNKDLRPLESDEYQYRLVPMQHCPCKRMIKVLTNANATEPALNETTCSEDAHKRGSGQKVRNKHYLAVASGQSASMRRFKRKRIKHDMKL